MSEPKNENHHGEVFWKQLFYYRYYREDKFTVSIEPVHKEITKRTFEGNIDIKVCREWGWGGSDLHQEAKLITWCKTWALSMSSNSAVSTTPSGLPSSPRHQLFLSAGPVLGETVQWWTSGEEDIPSLLTHNLQVILQHGQCWSVSLDSTLLPRVQPVTNLAREALRSILFPYSGFRVFQKSWARELWRFYSANKEGILEELASPEHSRASK